MAGRFERAQLLVDAGLADRADSRRRRRRAGRRSNPPGAPSGSPSTGTMPLPSLPVDSAMSCSAHAPNALTSGCVTIVSLSRPLDGEAADRGAEAHAWCGARIDGAVVGVHRAQRAIEQQVDVVARDRRRRDADERERRVAAADVRIVFEIGGGTILPWLRLSSVVPGSVIATKLRPATDAPQLLWRPFRGSTRRTRSARSSFRSCSR